MFKLGHWIIAIHSHPLELFKKGQFFRVQAIRLPYCKCHDYLVDIGLTSERTTQKCNSCNVVFLLDDTTSWFSNHNFESADHILESLLKENKNTEDNKQEN